MTTIKAAIQRFEDAVRDDEMKGAAPPHDHADIANELEEARAALENMVVGAEDELNCAEEVLDGLSVGLPMQATDFTCIGDYSKAVVEAQKKACELQGLDPSELESCRYCGLKVGTPCDVPPSAPCETAEEAHAAAQARGEEC